MEKIKIRKKREIGEIIGDAAKLYLRNLKTIIPNVLKVGLLPYLIAIGVIFLIRPFITPIVSDNTDGVFTNILLMQQELGATAVILTIGVFISQIFIYAYLFKWVEDYMNSDNLEMDNLGENYSPYIKTVFDTMLKIFLFSIAGIALLILFGAILRFLAFLIIIPVMFYAIYLSIVISLIFYLRIHEKLPFTESFQRCKTIIHDNWWNTFGLLFIAGIIAAVLNGLFSIPFSIISGAGGLLGVSSAIQPNLILAQSILTNLSALLIMPFSVFVIVLQYHNLVEYKDGSSLNKMVDDFDKPKDEFFENEGDF